MPLKAVILRQLELLLEKTLNYYENEEITDPSYLRAGYYDIALELEFILQNIDLIEFKKSRYERIIKRLNEKKKIKNKIKI